MGSNNHGFETPQDLRVTIQRSATVYPEEKKERRAMFLSNIDQVLDFNVNRVHFFAPNPEFPFAKVAEKLELAFTKLLSAYDFLAGRLRLNGEGRLEIDCNGAGAVLVVASSELSLADIGNLAFPNPAFMQLLARKPECSRLEEKILCALQVTSFTCGAFAMGTWENHTTMDGTSFKLFFENLASLTLGKHLVTPPFNDRQLLSARSPPRVSFPHPELLNLETHFTLPEDKPTLLKSISNNYEFRLFQLSSTDILTLKDKATSTNSERGPWITSFNVVTAHLWRCKVLANSEHDPDENSTILYAVDIRLRLQPPLPLSYTGNAVLGAYATTTCGELHQAPFGTLVELLYKGLLRMTDEYARSVIDWGQLYKGVPRSDVFVSSWWRQGTTEVEFPWGRAKYSGPVVQPSKDIILLCPNIEGDGGGVNAIVALPRDDMVKFEMLFNRFLLQ